MSDPDFKKSDLNSNDSGLILKVAEHRWNSIKSEYPELTDAITLQRRILNRSLKLSEKVDAYFPVDRKFNKSDIIHRLDQKIPAFSGESLAVDAIHLKPFLLGFCEDFSLAGGGLPVERLLNILTKEEINIASLLSASLMRQLKPIRTIANHISVSPDLLWLVAELSVAPIANQLQCKYLVSHEDIRNILKGWNKGFCPACGSWPAFAELVKEKKSLRCSFCGLAWTPAPYCCIYCEESSESFLKAVETGEKNLAVEMCRSCGGYLKRIITKRATPFELLSVEDLASSGVDSGAATQGYNRPPMQNFNDC